MSRGVRRCVAVAGVAAVLSFCVGVPAAAVTAEDGLWYVDAFHLADAHNAGFTGEGVTVAVIDTQINPNVAALRGANITVREPSFCDDVDGNAEPATTDSLAASHGTNVVSYIVGNGTADGGGAGVVGAAPGVAINFYAATIGSWLGNGAFCGNDDGREGSLGAFNEALDDGADIISISTTAGALDEWDEALVRAWKDGVVVLAALPNGPQHAADDLPFHNSVVAVQGVGADGAVNTTAGVTNSFDRVTVANAGSQLLIQGSDDAALTTKADVWTTQEITGGTSFATPLTAGFLAVAMQKYPDATGNQLIQSLIHNTGAGNPDLEWDDQYGYGIASLTAMLEVDPTTYPDVNPLIVDDPGMEPAAALFVPDASAEPAAGPAQHAAGTESNVVVPIVVGIGGLLVLAGVIVFVVFVRRRPRQRAIDRIRGEV